MNLEVILPETRPGRFFAIARGYDLKADGVVKLALPFNSNAIVESVKVVHRDVAALTNGATVVLVEFDANSPEHSTQATATSAFAVANAEIVITAVPIGSEGNSITLTLTDSAAPNTALLVEILGPSDINVILATDGSAAITTTAAQLKAAIEASAPASALITVAFAPANDGSGVVPATLIPLVTEGGATAFEGEIVQDIVNSVALGDTIANGSVESPALVATAKMLRDGSLLRFHASSWATATRDLADIIVSGILL